jgi:hypothetical protein
VGGLEGDGLNTGPGWVPRITPERLGGVGPWAEAG